MTSSGGSLRFSIVVASWHRPHWLRRCLKSLEQLDHPQFEVIVVADAECLAELSDSRLKTIEVGEANLSKARNAGILASGGDVCAFIDDDAVAEPMWLRHFEDGLSGTGADAIRGFVRGRNGISFQSRVESVDAEAETHLEQDQMLCASVPKLEAGKALKLVGTNMAVRREALLRAGGFDPNLRYFLDDTDLSLRLMKNGAVMAVAPDAEVHHGFAPSKRRDARRTPTDLFDIGRSTAIYLRRHLGEKYDEIFERIRKRELNRLIRHMVLGNCEPRDVARRMNGLSEGWRDGHDAELGKMELVDREPPFKPFESGVRGHEVFAARSLFRRRKLVNLAEKKVSEGTRASVFSFSLTTFRHHVVYTPLGAWVQTGGLFGRSDRNGAAIRWCKFADRRRMEIRRVAKARGLRND